MAAGAYAFVKKENATGELLGYWRTQIGLLGRFIVLRGFETAEDLAIERRRALHSADPFNGSGIVPALSMDSYAPFPFLPPVRPRQFGAVYEFRTYSLRPGGLAPTLAGWERAIKPAREYTAHVVTNMYALDGPPPVTHIWGFASLAERTALLAEAYAGGVWPPHGGPEQILEATSTIALPDRDSPLF